MNNFDLKKYLVENKLTENSKIINEGVSSEEMNMMAKALVDYYNAIDQLMSYQDGPKTIRQDLKTIINDRDNIDNSELQAAFKKLLQQEPNTRNRLIRKLWDMGVDLEDSY